MCSLSGSVHADFVGRGVGAAAYRNADDHVVACASGLIHTIDLFYIEVQIMTVLGRDCAPREQHDFFERSDYE